MKARQKRKWRQNRKYADELLIIATSIAYVIVLEIFALLTSPSLAVSGLAASIIGGLIGYWLGHKRNILIPEYRLSLGFGLIFMGLGLIIQQCLRLGMTWQLLEVRETYWGILLLILGVLITPTQKEYINLRRRKKRVGSTKG